MAQNNIQKFLVIGLLATMFIYIAIQLTFSLSNTYGADTSELTNNNNLDVTTIGALLNSTEGNATDYRNALENDEGNDVNKIESYLKLPKQVYIFIITPFKVISNILVDVFEIPVILVTVVEFMLIIGVIFAIIKLIRTGE